MIDYPRERAAHSAEHSPERTHLIIVRVPLVVTPDGGRYRFVCGDDALAELRRLALERNLSEVPVNLADWYTAEQLAEMALIESYRCDRLKGLTLGRLFVAHRSRYGVSQQELARRIWVTPGTIHHFESIERSLSPKLQEAEQAGRLNFKEARCLADIPDHERQEELASPFVSGRLSSVYVEKVVRIAKQRPSWTGEQVLEEALRDNAAARARVWKPAPERPRSVAVNVVAIEGMLIRATADLRNLARATTTEIDRMRLARLFWLHYEAFQDAVKALKMPMPKPPVAA